jgi:hypothetical protein
MKFQYVRVLLRNVHNYNRNRLTDTPTEEYFGNLFTAVKYAVLLFRADVYQVGPSKRGSLMCPPVSAMNNMGMIFGLLSIDVRVNTL